MRERVLGDAVYPHARSREDSCSVNSGKPCWDVRQAIPYYIASLETGGVCQVSCSGSLAMSPALPSMSNVK